MARLTGNETIGEAIIKLVDGNPGAVTAIVEMIQRQGEDSGFISLHHMDDTKLYGSKIWNLWKNICNFDGEKFDNLIKDIAAHYKTFHEYLNSNTNFPTS